MNVHVLSVGPLQANCYILDDEARAVVVDPGGDAARISNDLERRDLTLHEVWLTHAHFDHVGALAELVRPTGTDVPIRMHPADGPLLQAADTAAAAWGVRIPAPPPHTHDLVHGAILRFAGTDVHCLHTPGHAPGHVAFWIPSEGVVLAGDTLFAGSIGRTDLPLADGTTLLASIRERLLTLPHHTRVLPGHGPATDVGTESRTNPFLR